MSFESQTILNAHGLSMHFSKYYEKHHDETSLTSPAINLKKMLTTINSKLSGQTSPSTGPKSQASLQPLARIWRGKVTTCITDNDAKKFLSELNKRKQIIINVNHRISCIINLIHLLNGFMKRFITYQLKIFVQNL